MQGVWVGKGIWDEIWVWIGSGAGAATVVCDQVKHLKAKVDADEILETHFGLSDTVFCNAVIKDRPKTVGVAL